MFLPYQKNGLLWPNCSFGTIASNSTTHRPRLNALESHDLCALGLHSGRIAGNTHHGLTLALVSYAIALSCHLSNRWTSMPPMLSPMCQCTIANLSRISVIYIAQSPVNHAIPIKVAILSVAHLTKPKVIAIGIDSFYTPIAFLSYQCVKALKLFVVNDP